MSNYELGSPEYEVYEGPARDLANAANAYFNDRSLYAIELAKALTTVRIEIILDRFERANRYFTLTQLAAAVLMPNLSEFEHSTIANIEPLSPAYVEDWQAMFPEQQTKAAKLRHAIASGPLQEYGVTASSLQVIMTREKCERHFVLVHTGAGIDIGDHSKKYDKARNYRSVMLMKNNKLFSVNVDGINYDTRTGMTDKNYVALVKAARAHGQLLPDSEELASANNDVETWTMLTGEPQTDGFIQIRQVCKEKIIGRSCDSTNDRNDLRVRPAVQID